MIRITYAPDLVEQAVLLAERTLPVAEAHAFRRERDRIYAIADLDRREEAFRAVHQRWFARLQLDRIVGEVTRGYSGTHQSWGPASAGSWGRLAACRVLPALSRRDEGADLVDAVAAADGSGDPILVLRLCPATLVDPGTLQALLHHELTHVADMLDPAFGYERTLPASEDGPSADNILRDRYRVVWDTTIDGRLTRAGLASGVAREARWQEFAAAFALLGSSCRSVFEEWFTEAHPTHARLLAFASQPSRSVDAPDPGRCPLCRFPVASLDSRAGTMPEEAKAFIQANHPRWRPEHGLCAQCFDLYEARYDERAGIGDRGSGIGRIPGGVATR